MPLPFLLGAAQASFGAFPPRLPSYFVGAFPTLKRGVILRCASGAGFRERRPVEAIRVPTIRRRPSEHSGVRCPEWQKPAYGELVRFPSLDEAVAQYQTSAL